VHRDVGRWSTAGSRAFIERLHRQNVAADM